MAHLVAPSVLSADLTELGKAVATINESRADWFHLDVMDGMFVPNISFGLPVIRDMKGPARKPFDVHLMVADPERYIHDFRDAGADMLTVHYEACTHLHRAVTTIREAGMRPGVALNPHTPVHLLEDILHAVDLVCVMAVNPGYGGQSFIDRTYAKVERLRDMITDQQADVWIELDGGVNLENAPALVDKGVDVLVAGSTVFKSNDPPAVIDRLKDLSREPVDGG